MQSSRPLEHFGNSAKSANVGIWTSPLNTCTTIEFCTTNTSCKTISRVCGSFVMKKKKLLFNYISVKYSLFYLLKNRPVSVQVSLNDNEQQPILKLYNFASIHFEFTVGLVLLTLTTVPETLQLSLTANKHGLICISFILFLLVEFCFFFPSYEFSIFNLHYRLNPNSLRNTLEVQKSSPSCLPYSHYDGWTNSFLHVWARGA